MAGYYYADSANGGLSHEASYVYDGGSGANGVNRLTSATVTPVLSGTFGYSESFSYDIYGNMSCSANPPAAQCLTTVYNNPNNNQINHITSNGVNTSYQYDLGGNLWNDGTNTYQWDAEGHLGAVYQGTTLISMNTYNALGQRVEDMTPTSTTDEAYGAGGNLLLRYTGDSNSRSFIPFNGLILAEYYCGGMIFDHFDEIGTATTATDCAGNVVQERQYYPFGEFANGAGSTGMHQEFAKLPDYDPETDEYNTANRHYTPSGRWLSPDPLGQDAAEPGEPQTWNMYAYAGNNPTTNTDPGGELYCSDPDSHGVMNCVTDKEYFNNLDNNKYKGYKHYNSNLDPDPEGDKVRQLAQSMNNNHMDDFIEFGMGVGIAGGVGVGGVMSYGWIATGLYTSAHN